MHPTANFLMKLMNEMEPFFFSLGSMFDMHKLWWWPHTDNSVFFWFISSTSTPTDLWDKTSNFEMNKCYDMTNGEQSGEERRGKARKERQREKEWERRRGEKRLNETPNMHSHAFQQNTRILITYCWAVMKDADEEYTTHRIKWIKTPNL